MVVIEMADEEYRGVEKLAERVNAECDYSCKPRIVLGRDAEVWITGEREYHSNTIQQADSFSELDVALEGE